MTTQPVAGGELPDANGGRDASPAGCGGAAPLGPGAREFLKALASEQRQQMLELFTGGVEITVGGVAERLAISQPAASQQLAILRRGGLLTSRKVGKQVHYRIDSAAVDASLTELRTYLHTCCPPPDPEPSG
ncbi:ArsR/SmtB family transcription factor [Actinomadura algeriensis]|uniref:DNA-binding transcriptional ArsR family regulator n=1 Tax=Actinomadura algeriensis TaxID=1679523 RepID=A0ABR9JYE1_9ACTN|nr:metalloregulator ArsR/SmtB family transcription factor [Actinomadura algeriensis]MBE1535601.1 DNA-binding transcriptional ArsR family regulator [Actinomadura algeriensis]